MAIDPLEAAKGNWRLLLESLTKLSSPGEDQIRDPEVDEAFGWEGVYLPLWQSEERGWISAELRSGLDLVEGLLARASSSSKFWTDEAILYDPLWNGIRRAARHCLSLAGPPDAT
jgi:hypothetical protein